jgi:hypothetical protein
MTKFLSVCLAWIVCICACQHSAFSQSAAGSGVIRGSVVDPTGATIANATVTVKNPVSGLTQEVKTGADGSFVVGNLPFSHYHLTVTAPGFQSADQDADLRSAVPVRMKISLLLGAASTTINVTENSEDLIDTGSTTETNIDRSLFEKLPLESQSSSLSSLVTLSSPGVTSDSNGMFHGLGDHASNSFSIDGQPITDQQSKVFSNQLPVTAIDSMQVIEGAPPAEYGDKTSLVVVATTRSGLGVNQPHGDVTASYGTFGSATAGFDLAYGGQTWGNFISLSGLNTGRFLDTPEFNVMHDKGNEESFFDRVDLKPTNNDTFSLNLELTRSWFQTPNSYDAQNATAWSGLTVDNGGIGPNGVPVGSQDQRSQIRTFDIAPSWTRILNPNTVFTLGGFARQDQYDYYPSDNPFADLTPGVQSTTIGQDRTLTNLGLRSSLSYVKGIHNIKAGATFEDTILTENDRFGVVDPALNAPCLNSDGSAFTGAGLTNPSDCATASLMQNPSFVPLLACYDLTRTSPLPASDGCPNSTSGTYLFRGHADIRETALYIEDNISVNNWNFSLGIRGDIYDGITKATQAEPRLGGAYHIKKTGTVLRLSYARTLETPFNENLVLSSVGCNDPAINALESVTQGYPCLARPLSPGTRNEYHAGFEQAFGRYFVLDAEYIWKYTNNPYDFSVFGYTPITYPIEWTKSKIPGYAIRGSMPSFHGLTAFVVMSSVSARFFEPQVSGIGVTPSSIASNSTVFRIDHDENFNETTHFQYQPKKDGPWIGFNWRYDSGMVAGPVPCAGGDCANGPNGTGSVIDVSSLTPDQQFEAGLYCGSVHATPTMPISPTGFCAASQYGSNLVKIPAPGTENDDHNPPRISPRNVFDVALGDDNLFHNERYKWSGRLEVVNLTNEYALYNFLSTFSGTHYLSPRTFTGTLGFHF